jgi:Ca2+-binding RTX toxin-like protein
MKRLSAVIGTVVLMTGLLLPGVALAAAPVNDDFAAAEVLEGSVGGTTGTNVGATSQVGEPTHAGSGGGASVWYEWTAPASERAVIHTRWSGFDTVLAVYTGSSVDSLTEVASNDDSGPYDSDSAVRFDAVEGTTYRIAVDGFNGKKGEFDLHWALRPANDDFAEAELVSGRDGDIYGYNVLATREEGEPKHTDGGFRSVWYRWIAPASRTVRFQSMNVGKSDSMLDLYSPRVAVYTGSNVDTLTAVISSRGGATFDATEGTTYSIAVAGGYGDSGDFMLKWAPAMIGTPQNDELTGTNKAEFILGRGGDDLILGRGGEDWLTGGDGVDQIIGGDDSSFLMGGENADEIIGGTAPDKLKGNDGADRLVGDEGNDQLKGGDGQDRLNALDGSSFVDRVNGGDNKDTCRVDPEDQVTRC